MLKSLESKELQAAAEATFKQYPKENVVYVASDGNVFLKANKGDALNHSRENEVQITRFDRPGTTATNTVAEIKERVLSSLLSSVKAGEPEQDAEFRGTSIDLGKATGDEVVHAILTETRIHADNKALLPDDSSEDNQTSGTEVEGKEEEKTGAPVEGEQISGQATTQAGEQLTLEPAAPAATVTEIAEMEKAPEPTKKKGKKSSTKTETA